MNISDLKRNKYMLKGSLAKRGFDWWWHSFTARHETTSEERVFFIQYFIINPKISPDKIVLGHDIHKSLPSYFMMKCGSWGKDKTQIHQYFPINEVKINDKELNIKVGDCFLSETKISGKCIATAEEADNPIYMTDKGEMEWNLSVNKKIAFNLGYSTGTIFRLLNASDMFWHAEGIKTEYSGYVIQNGEKYIVEPENCFGYADKNWGKDFITTWVGLSSCNIQSLKNKRKLNNSAIIIGGGRPRILGIPFHRRLLIGIYYEGKMIEFNFCKPWIRSRVEYCFNELEDLAIFNICAQNSHYKIRLVMKCNLEDMLKMNYITPKGQILHKNLLSGGNGVGSLKIYNKHNQIIDDLEFRHTVCEHGEY